MALIKAHDLAYTLETLILRKLKAAHVPRAKSVTDDLVRDLIWNIPSEVYEWKPPQELGFLFFHGEVEEDYVKLMQEEILFIHHNVKAGIPLTVFLSSIGGSFDAGLALYATIQEVRRGGRKTIAVVQGSAMSMGSVFAQGFDDRLIEPHATVMIHESYDVLAGKIGDIEDAIVYNKRADSVVCSIYSSRSGKPSDYWRDKMTRKDVYLTAREAVSEGLMDRIRPIPLYKGKVTRKKQEES